MISRIADQYNFISDECYEKLAKTLENKDNKKLFSVVSSEDEAKEIRNKLAKNGYSVSIEKYNDMFKVLYSSEQPKIKATRETLACFENVGNNQFKALQKIAGVYDYAFDDGSIWKIQKIDGIEYLVKEINDENDENDVIRKTASSTKTAMDKDTFTRIMNMYYGKYTKKIIAEISNNEILKKDFENIIENNLKLEIANTLKKNKLIASNKLINELHNKLLNNKEMNSHEAFEKFIISESKKDARG